MSMAPSSPPSSHAPPPPGTGIGPDSASSWSPVPCLSLPPPSTGAWQPEPPAPRQGGEVWVQLQLCRAGLQPQHPCILHPFLQLLLPPSLHPFLHPFLLPSIPSSLYPFHCLSSKHSLSSHHTGCWGRSRFSAELRSSPFTAASGPRSRQYTHVGGRAEAPPPLLHGKLPSKAQGLSGVQSRRGTSPPAWPLSRAVTESWEQWDRSGGAGHLSPQGGRDRIGRGDGGGSVCAHSRVSSGRGVGTPSPEQEE